MKFSLESIKISIAGAKLSHLVQKDKIWDHGSMTEQARIIFYLVQKANSTGNIESLKKYLTITCYEKLENDVTLFQIENPVITELAVIEVSPGKNNRPDMFTACFKGYSRKDNNLLGNNRKTDNFCFHWVFARQSDWWMLDKIKA